MDKPWKVILAFVGVFMAGAIFGGLFTLGTSAKWIREERALDRPTTPSPVVVVEKQPATPGVQPGPSSPQTPPRPAPSREERDVMAVMRQLKQQVNPTAEQSDRLRQIVARAIGDMRRLEREHWTESSRVTQRMYEDLAAVLSSDQRIQLEKMRQEMLERTRAKEKQRLESQSKGAGARPNANKSTPPGTRQQGP